MQIVSARFIILSETVVADRNEGDYLRSKNQELMKQIVVFIDDFYKSHHRAPKLPEIAEHFHIVKSTVSRYLSEMDERGMIRYSDGIASTTLTEKFDTELLNVGIIGSISCGTPQLEEEYVEEYVTLPVSMFGKGDFYILRASGQSMIGAGIDDGDLVVIKKQDQAKDGDIVVALVENENTLKRLYKDTANGCVRLHPENSAMEDIIVPSCCIQGVAVNVIKSLT